MSAKLKIEEIAIIRQPVIELKWSDGQKSDWNVESYLKKVIEDPKSEYWGILKPENFKNVYLADGFIKWDGIITQMYCGGDTSAQPVYFSSIEIAKDLASKQTQLS